MADREHQFLHLQGFIHEIDIAPAGTVADPWPFVMEVNSGTGNAAVQIHEDDAQVLVEFFQQFLPKGVQASTNGV